MMPTSLKEEDFSHSDRMENMNGVCQTSKLCFSALRLINKTILVIRRLRGQAAGMEQSLHVTMATDMMLISKLHLLTSMTSVCMHEQEPASQGSVALLYKTLSFSPLYMWEPYLGSSEVMASIIALTVSSLTCAAHST